MRKFKTIASKRMFSYSSRGPSGEARRTPGQSPLPPVASPNGSGIGLADLPEDIVVLILCHDLELADLVAVSETCRRLYAMSFAELPWIKLWHHLNQRGELPPPPIAYRRLPDIAAQPFTRRTTLGPDITSSSGSRMRHCSSSSTKTFRSRLQRIYSVERRIRTNEETIRAREVAVLVQDVDSDDWVLMAMTAGGEVVVLWMLSGLLVFDLVHGTSLTVHLDREDSECPENFKFAVTMCEYGGEVGVLVVGALVQDRNLCFLFQALPGYNSSPQSSKVPSYHILAAFLMPSRDRIMTLEFSERYVMIGVVNWDIHNRARHYLQVLDLQGERSMYIPHTDQIQRAYFSGQKLTVCFKKGDVREYGIEVIESRIVVSGSYRFYLAKRDPGSQYTFCDPVPQTSSDDDTSPALPELKCWKMTQRYGEINALTLSLNVVALSSSPDANAPSTADNRSSKPSPKGKFRLRTLNSPSSTRSTIPSISHITSHFNNSGKAQDITPKWLVAGRSTFLTGMSVPDLRSDALLLSYASREKRTAIKDADDSWSTTYRIVRTEAPNGTSTEFTPSGMGQISSILWNDYTGQIVIRSRVSDRLTVRILQI